MTVVVGQRVRISEAGLATGIHQKTGVVQQISPDGYPLVLWEGWKTPTIYHADFIEPALNLQEG